MLSISICQNIAIDNAIIQLYNFLQMSQKIKYLKQSELTKVLADGFAQLYHNKPQFPVTFLANYLKNYNYMKSQESQVARKLQLNAKIIDNIKAKSQLAQLNQAQNIKVQEKIQQNQQSFRKLITDAEAHQDILNIFCEWLEKKYSLTGVYLGQSQLPNKKIDIQSQDSEQAHIEAENPKIIKFKASSNSHKFMCLKTLQLQSIVGKLTTEKAGGEAPPEEGQQGGQPKVGKPQGEIYLSSVVGNSQLHFFKYPKLGSYFAVLMKVKSYLSEKSFNSNIVKVQAYKKAAEEFNKQHEQRETKFKELYDEKVNGGTEEKQLQQMERQYESEKAQFKKPQLQEFQYSVRDFVVCFDTLGQDKEIEQSVRKILRAFVELLKQEWQNRQISLLKNDIETQLKLIQGQQAPQQQQFNKLIQDEEREIPGNEEVQKVKNDEKLMQLQMDTIRIEKLKQYMTDEKYAPYLEAILSFNVLKYSEIIKHFMFFLQHNKKSICIKDTNVLDWRNCKRLLTKNKILEVISNYNPRGAKINNVLPYAKWQRIGKNLQKFQAVNIASYNIYLAFILRFLQITARVRVADRLARVKVMKHERFLRQERIAERRKKEQEKQEKLAALKAQAEQKEQAFDQEAWILNYDEENAPIEIGDEIADEIDNDLLELVMQEEPAAEIAPQ